MASDAASEEHLSQIYGGVPGTFLQDVLRKSLRRANDAVRRNAAMHFIKIHDIYTRWALRLHRAARENAAALRCHVESGPCGPLLSTGQRVPALTIKLPT